MPNKERATVPEFRQSKPFNALIIPLQVRSRCLNWMISREVWKDSN